VLLGIGVAGTKEPVDPNPVTVIISLAAFAAGAMLATPILKAFGGGQETADNQVFQAWPRRVSIALAIALILQAGFLAVWITAVLPASLAYILMALSALAMGCRRTPSATFACPAFPPRPLPPPSSAYSVGWSPGRSPHTRRGGWPPPW
jgi:hypothetical protein